MYFSKRMNLDGNGITAEIAELSYSIQFKSGVNMYLKEGDLVTFIKKYIPEIKIDDYFEASFKVFQHYQNIELLYFVRSKLDETIRKHFCDAMYDIELDAYETSGYCYDSFNDMKADDNGALFFNACKDAYDNVKNGTCAKVTSKLNLHSSSWRFYNDDMRFDDEELSIVVNEKALSEIVKYIREDFAANGEQTLNSLKTKENSNSYVSVDFFLQYFEKDYLELQASDFTYEKFANFLNKYKLISQGD